MEKKSPLVLIAGPAEVCCKQLLPALEDVDVLHCETLDQAVERIKHDGPQLIVLCLLFDEMRPFRLIHYVRSELQRSDLPIVLVQVADGQLGSSELKRMSDAYESIGVDGFLNFAEDVEAYGKQKALQRFRTSVIRRLGAQQN